MCQFNNHALFVGYFEVFDVEQIDVINNIQIERMVGIVVIVYFLFCGKNNVLWTQFSCLFFTKTSEINDHVL